MAKSEHRLSTLQVGDRWWTKYKGYTYEAEVVETESGPRVALLGVALSGEKSSYDVELVRKTGPKDRVLYKGLSVASAGITGRVQTIGTFWKPGSPTDPKETPAPAAEDTAPPAASTSKTKVIRKLTNQSKAPEGQVKWFCNACMSGFTAPKGVTPTACPQGHRAETDGNGQVVEGTPAPEAPAEEAPEEPAPLVVTFEQKENQGECGEGQTLWHCSGCNDDFCYPEGLTPTECVAGHVPTAEAEAVAV